MLAVGGAVLGNAAIAIQVGVRAIGQHLREASIQIQRVGRRHVIIRLLEPVAEAVVHVGVDIR